MLRSYLLLTLRALKRQRVYAFLNIVGLGVGVACCLFLLFYVQDEWRYDRYHDAPETVFRIHPRFDEREIALSPPFVAGLLARELPAVEAATRVQASGGLLRFEERVFDERGIFFVDSTFFDVMTHPLVAGDARTALSRPNTIVLTESTARKYFGDADPIGRLLQYRNDQLFEVTGVVEDVPAHSHYHFNALASLSTFESPRPDVWSNANYYTYVRARNAEAAADLPAQIDRLLARLKSEGQEPWALYAFPLTDLHLRSQAEYELDTGGSIGQVYGLATVALLILLIACINYMNLSTARSAQRAQEVGLRKSLGAFRHQIVQQFYGESALLTLASVVLALGLVALLLPSFNALSGKALTLSALATPTFVLLIGVVFALVSVVAGSYPAFYLSRFQPVRVVHGGGTSGRGASWLRQGLVVFQFGISTILVVGTLVVMGQLRYLGDRDMGFDKEHLVVLNLGDPAMREAYPAMQEEIERHPGVLAVAGINQVPGQLGWTSRFRTDAMPDDEHFFTRGLPADRKVTDGLGLQRVAGIGFPPTAPLPDSTNYLFIVNTTLAARAGWTPEEAVGQRVAVDNRRGEIVGVVEDFHFRSLHDPIDPLAIWFEPDNVFNLAVRLAPGDPSEAMAHLASTWSAFAPHRPFAYRFVDEVYDALYQSEQRFGRVVAVFAFLALLVACLGLFGLAAFTVEKRTREIGIRKSLGATAAGLVALLTKDFVVLVGIAFAVAVPLAWMGIGKWLDGFAYHIALGPGVFLLAGALVLLVALATVGTHALRAASVDPVQSLRQE